MEIVHAVQQTIIDPLHALLDRMTGQLERLSDRVDRMEQLQLEAFYRITSGALPDNDPDDEAA
jgi:hypothetical protein